MLFDSYAFDLKSKPNCLPSSLHKTLSSLETPILTGEISVPYTAGSMVGYWLLSSPFSFLHCIVEKKVNQNSIDSETRMIPDDLPSDQLYAPNTTGYQDVSPVPLRNLLEHTSKLNLPLVAAFYQLFLANCALKCRTVPQASQRIQYLRYSIVCKHCDLVDIVKFPETLPVKSRPKISNANLSPFQEPDTFAIFVFRHIIEAGKVCC